MRILVTGGGGFIGRNVTKRLIEDGHEVTITTSGTDVVVPGVHKVLYMGLDGIDWSCANNMDAVVHQMANNDTRCMDREEMFRANVDGPMKLFRYAFQKGCKRFVYASSTAVYGNSPAPYVEGVTAEAPLNPYAESKLYFDNWVLDNFSKWTNVSVVGLRYCNVYGPGEEGKGRRMSMIGQMIQKLQWLDEYDTEVAVRLFKHGEQKRDWVYIDDVVEANTLALAKTAEPGFNGIYNVGSGVASTFNEVVDVINSYIGANGWKLVPEYIDCPFPDEYQGHTECGIEKARGELGYSPRYDLRSGIGKFLELNQFGL